MIAKNKIPSLVEEGTKIIVPKGMSKTEAIKWLEKMEADDQTTIQPSVQLPCHPNDGLWALHQSLAAKYGWVDAVPTESFFGRQPPSFTTLEVAPGKFEQVLTGQFKLPGISGIFAVGGAMTPQGPVFTLYAEIKKKHQAIFDEIAEATREYLRTNSIYRGKPFYLATKDNGQINLSGSMKFMDVGGVKAEDLIFPLAVQEQIETNLFTPIEFTEKCSKYQIPLKRGVLLEGPYGVGKTLTAAVTAQKCMANGWTFIYLDKVAGLKSAISLAKLYEPAVIFAEDIDRVTDGERDADLDNILNTIDGVDSKDRRLMVVLTTNFVEKIDKAMLRPGRLDSVISLQAPDQEAVQRLIRLYGRDLIPETERLEGVGEILQGEIPAVIREVVERAKLYAVPRTNGHGMLVDAMALEAAAKGMKRHLALLKGQRKRSVLEQVGAAVVEEKKLLDAASGYSPDALQEAVSELSNRLDD